MAEVGVFISRLIPEGLAGDLLFPLPLKSSFTPTKLMLFLDFSADNGDTNISPGPSGVSGICAYRTESGVPADAGVEAADEGDGADFAGVLKSSCTPPRLVLFTDFLAAFCGNTCELLVTK